MRTTPMLAMLAACLLGGLVLLAATPRRPAPLQLALSAPALSANGIDTVVLTVRAPRGSLRDVRASSDAPRAVRVEAIESDGPEARVILRAGVLPGHAAIRIDAPGAVASSVAVDSVASSADSLADGTPDFLRLGDEADRVAFRTWFTRLAEAQYFRDPSELPDEIDDCAALIRFAYRESLRRHDGAWLADMRLPASSAIPPVRKYEYPFTPLGAGLFRVRDGAFSASDASDGAFAEFADAATLRRFNTHFVTRDVRRALPGDLLFFRQSGRRMPDHAMIFVGASRFSPADGDDWIVYHTGPSRSSPGEIRRLRLAALLAYPQAEWRPAAYNEAFLGVYRWNILRGLP
jgi:uncharacterized protein YfaT (DUF1175 family)